MDSRLRGNDGGMAFDRLRPNGGMDSRFCGNDGVGGPSTGSGRTGQEGFTTENIEITERGEGIRFPPRIVVRGDVLLRE